MKSKELAASLGIGYYQASALLDVLEWTAKNGQHVKAEQAKALIEYLEGRIAKQTKAGTAQ